MLQDPNSVKVSDFFDKGACAYMETRLKHFNNKGLKFVSIKKNINEFQSKHDCEAFNNIEKIWKDLEVIMTLKLMH